MITRSADLKLNVMGKEINGNEGLLKTSVMCCDYFEKNIHKFGWFKIDHLGEEQYLMPHILGTNYRINFCPSCGKEVRDIILSSDFYHNT